MINHENHNSFFIAIENSQEQIEKTIESTMKLLKESESGPQSVSITREDIQHALKSPETVVAKLGCTKLPVLIPISCIEAFNSTPYYSNNSTNYAFLPDYSCLPDQDITKIERTLAQYEKANTVTVVTYFEDSNERTTEYVWRMLSSMNMKSVPNFIVDHKSNSPASVAHYEGEAKLLDRSLLRKDVKSLRAVFLEGLATGDYEENPHTGTTMLDPNSLRNDSVLLNKLWTISNEQFSLVVENLPVRQNPTYDEFIEIMTHPETSTIAYFENGDPVCITTFLHSIEPAEWLRESYFNDRFGADTFIAYFAFMVSDVKKANLKSSHKVLNMLVDLVERASSDLQVVFECTNVSSAYIPKIVESVVNASGKVQIYVREYSRYTFKTYTMGETE